MIPGLGSQAGAEPPSAGQNFTTSELVPTWLQYLRLVWEQTAYGVVYTTAERLHTLLSLYLRQEAPDRGDKHLYRLSLTMPSWEHSPIRLQLAAQALADSLAAEPDSGAWLAIDVSEVGQEHLYGVAITSRPSKTIVEEWIKLTGASEQGCRVRPVTGQKHGWGDSGTHRRRRPKLSGNLARVINYGLKTLPPRYAMTERERVISTGCLRMIWERAFAEPPSSEAPQQKEPPQLEPGVRCCERCGRRLPSKLRKHAHWCSPSCRTMAYEMRRGLRAQLVAEELDAFEERAAILEFEAGLSRSRAEQLAHEQTRNRAAGPMVTSSLPAAQLGGSI